MKSRLDIRSILVGALIGAAALAILGAAAPVIEPSRQVGRFQVSACTTGNGESVGYVVDTVTGQVWTSRSDGFREPKTK